MVSCKNNVACRPRLFALHCRYTRHHAGQRYYNAITALLHALSYHMSSHSCTLLFALSKYVYVSHTTQVNGAPFRNGGSPFASNGGRVTGRAEMAGDNAPAIEAIAMQRTSESASVVAASAAARESTQGGSVGGGVVRSGKVSESGSAVHHQNPSRLTSHNLQRITAGNASTRSQLKGTCLKPSHISLTHYCTAVGEC